MKLIFTVLLVVYCSVHVAASKDQSNLIERLRLGRHNTRLTDDSKDDQRAEALEQEQTEGCAGITEQSGNSFNAIKQQMMKKPVEDPPECPSVYEQRQLNELGAAEIAKAEAEVEAQDAEAEEKAEEEQEDMIAELTQEVLAMEAQDSQQEEEDLSAPQQELPELDGIEDEISFKEEDEEEAKEDEEEAEEDEEEAKEAQEYEEEEQEYEEELLEEAAEALEEQQQEQENYEDDSVLEATDINRWKEQAIQEVEQDSVEQMDQVEMQEETVEDFSEFRERISGYYETNEPDLSQSSERRYIETGVSGSEERLDQDEVRDSPSSDIDPLDGNMPAPLSEVVRIDELVFQGKNEVDLDAANIDLDEMDEVPEVAVVKRDEAMDRKQDRQTILHTVFDFDALESRLDSDSVQTQELDETKETDEAPLSQVTSDGTSVSLSAPTFLEMKSKVHSLLKKLIK